MAKYFIRFSCRAWLLVGALVLAAAAPALAQSDFATFESVTVAGASIGLATTTFRPTGQPPMAMCLGRAENAEVRYRMDGTAPTTTEGTLLEPGETLPLWTSGDMTNVRFISTTSASALVKVTCWRVARAVEPLPGLVYARQDHPGRFHCVVAVSTATTLQAVGGSCAAPGAGVSLYVTDVVFAASAAGIAADAFPTLKWGTNGTCGVGTTVFWQALTAAAIVAVDNRSIPIKVPANNEICWISSTAGSKAIQISGFIAP